MFKGFAISNVIAPTAKWCPREDKYFPSLYWIGNSCMRWLLVRCDDQMSFYQWCWVKIFDDAICRKQHPCYAFRLKRLRNYYFLCMKVVYLWVNLLHDVGVCQVEFLLAKYIPIKRETVTKSDVYCIAKKYKTFLALQKVNEQHPWKIWEYNTVEPKRISLCTP